MAERKQPDRRRQVMEAAARSFETFGYKGTTMDQVAKLAQVGKGTIYTFYANKEELFEEIMKGLIQELKVVADETQDGKLPFADNLMNVLHKVSDYRDRHALAAKLSQEVRDIGTPMAKEGLEKVEKAIIGYIARHVKEASDKGEIRPCSPELTAYMMLKMYLALTAEGHHLHEPLGKEEILESFRFYCFEGLAIR
ncbi:TetR/AcrR family transcriptional regulator [Cohnella thailandensis]|uniref:TetR/AcrR family transcriptional regulator n=1 Tax=Cohnella thailandensis TaxID=557557 RepID=A0A841SRZ5_9BACL|nr:TetR/AcrR family transcriptional regulator [Cohnella thailandensis]MBB6635143.1 TetR/AcrR family transcriptional regulator [Cohnella thailandensis]MBP1974391.1 AcrR family transcriptional regulator [Cohnella thailandensis]